MFNLNRIFTNYFHRFVVVMNTMYRVQNIFKFKSGIALIELQHQVTSMGKFI